MRKAIINVAFHAAIGALVFGGMVLLCCEGPVGRPLFLVKAGGIVCWLAAGKVWDIYRDLCARYGIEGVDFEEEV